MTSPQRIWLSSPHTSGRELKYLQQALDSNLIAPLGPNVNEFEKEIAGYIGMKHASALSAGTAAIHLALILLGVESGDEVIASSFTFSATVNPIRYVNATPILVDSEPETWNMSPVELERAIKDRISKGKKPKAIIVVHLYGMPAMMDEIMSIASKYEIPLIEDAAEALGSQYKGKRLGSFGLMNILSFNGNKIITTSGGGALLSDDDELISRSRFLATQARDQAPHYQHSTIGYNYRMSNIVAGIGRGQMEVLDERVEKRRENFFYYKEQLSGVNGISFQEEPNDDYYSNHWLTTILIDPQQSKGKTREDLRLYLESKNIETRPLWKPMHLQPVFAACPAYTNGVSDRLFETGLCLPSSSNITNDERDSVVSSIKEILS
ncbi:MAG: aminotransferase class I/II-fold pyridoxal phosphate-dependent enzyme [Bacteroidales bacterium]|nr:aminotransferase class I/II-fold pyridoxal phosphate-dependent enzyme [Bacteroidales bacterium]